ncbi:hypothetical protein ACFFQF_29785 [Haladaptatus pallidirubidus]
MATPVCHKRAISYELASPRVHRLDVEHTNPTLPPGVSNRPTPIEGILAL